MLFNRKCLKMLIRFCCKVKSESTDDLAFLLKHYKKKSQGIIA